MPRFDPETSLSIGSIAAHPTDPDIVYVGTGEDNGGGYSYEGDGVYKTTDGGLSWRNLGLAEVRRIGQIALHPAILTGTPSRQAAIGSSKDAHRGIYRSTDSGESWQKVLFVADDAGGIDVAVDPSNPTASTPPLAAAEPGGHLEYRGTPERDLALSRWRDDLDEARKRPSGDGGPNRPGHFQVEPGDRLCRHHHTDGDSRRNLSHDERGRHLGEGEQRHGALALQHLQLLLRKRPGGSLEPQHRLRPRRAAPQVHERRPELHAHRDGRPRGRARSRAPSLDGHLLRGHGWGLLPEPRRRSELDPLGHAADRPVLRSRHRSRPARTSVCRGPGQRDAADDDRRPRRLVGSERGRRPPGRGGSDRRQQGLRRNPVRSGPALDGRGDTFTPATNGIDPEDRTNWNTPISLDPVVPTTLYRGTSLVYRATDSAQNWTPISGDLTKGPGLGEEPARNPRWLDRDRGGRNHLENLISGTITVVAVSPVERDILWAGIDDGNVWVSADRGAN